MSVGICFVSFYLLIYFSIFKWIGAFVDQWRVQLKTCVYAEVKHFKHML